MFKLDLPLEKMKSKYIDEASKFVTIDGMEIHYKDEGEGEAVFLIHEAGTSLHIWDEWAAILSPHFRVIRFDLPGFGVSEMSPYFDARFDVYVYFIKKINAAVGLGLTHFSIAGVGFGGHLAWQYTLLHPHRVHKLCLINAPTANDKPAPTLFKQQQLSAFGRWLLRWRGGKNAILEQLKTVVGNTKILNDTFLERTIELLLPQGNRKRLAQLSKIPFKDRSNRLKEIKTPTLIMKSGLFKSADFLVQQLPNSSVKTYDKIGLLPMLEIAETSANDFLHFLKKNEHKKTN